MKTISATVIENTVKRLCIKANVELRKDVLSALKHARDREKNAKAKRVLNIIIYNALIGRKKKLPICQDTGMVVVYLKIGQEVKVFVDTFPG